MTASLVALFAKTVFIFFLTYICGRACARGSSKLSPFSNWVLLSGVGIALLNLASAFGSIYGFTSRKGLYVLMAFVLVRLLYERQRSKNFSLWVKGLNPKLVLLLAILGATSYLAPFVVKMTSGYYSRGGGDHNTYLSLSDWYVDHPFWAPVSEQSALPPQPHFEVNYFTKFRQQVCIGCYQPLANQYVAAPFMALLPGPAEETYSATVAVYLTFAGLAVASLILTLLVSPTPSLWQIIFASVLPLTSNLLLYVATMQSIPYLIAIVLSATLLGLHFLLAKNKWVAERHEALCSAVIGGGLLALYPHIYFFTYALLGMLFLAYWPRSYLRQAVMFNVRQIVYAFLIVNVVLIINLQLILAGATSPGGMLLATPWLKLFAAQSGFVDFEILKDLANNAKNYWTLWGLGGLGLAFLAALRVVRHTNRKATALMVAWYATFVLGTVFYNFKNYSWQMIRFSQFGHLILLATAGLGVAFLTQKSTLRRRLVVLFLIVASMSVSRIVSIKDVVGKNPGFQTEFRDASQLSLVKALEHEQSRSATTESPRIIYYLGPGFGVDHAGASVLLRSTAYLAPRGYQYGELLRKVGVWDESYLKDALLLVNPPGIGDIVHDQRQGSAEQPRWTSSRLLAYDTKDQNVSQLLGDAWNAASPLNRGASVHPFRYLKGKTAALVIWSQTQAHAKMTIEFASDSDNATLEVASNRIKAPTLFAAKKWTGAADSMSTVQIDVMLNAGPNVILLSPQTSDINKDVRPWMLVTKILITN